jgi:hypothetical protein
MLFMNPYTLHRFTRCPETGEPTQKRRMPFLIHAEPMDEFLLVNLDVRVSTALDLVIVHVDRTAALIGMTLEISVFSHPELRFRMQQVDRAYYNSSSVKADGWTSEVMQHLILFDNFVHYEPCGETWQRRVIDPNHPPFRLSGRGNGFRWQIHIDPSNCTETE